VALPPLQAFQPQSVLLKQQPRSPIRLASATTNQTLLDRLRRLALEVEDALVRLASESRLEHNKRFVEDGWPVTVIGQGPRPGYWASLSPVGLMAQDDAFIAYSRFSQLGQFVLGHGTGERLERFSQNAGVVHQLINQDKESPHRGIEEWLSRCKGALKEQVRALSEAAFGPTIGRVVVPDTMAIIQLPRLSVLQFPKEDTLVVLVPTVLRELDRHKVGSRSPALGAKARKAIRRIKEYRRRGNLLHGVPDSKRVRVGAVATEPAAPQYLSWLDPLHDDDRLIASTLHVAALNFSSPVFLLTSDVNLQNKATFAALAALDADDYVLGDKARRVTSRLGVKSHHVVYR